MFLTKLRTCVLVGLLLTGCQTVEAANPSDYEVMFSKTNIYTDKYKGTENYNAPRINFSNQPTYFLRAISSDKRVFPEVLQIYIEARFFKDWKFLEHAYSQGQSLDVVVIDRSVDRCIENGCYMDEVIAINITKDDLEVYAQQGFDAKLEGKGGVERLRVPPEYFAAFRDKLLEYVALQLELKELIEKYDALIEKRKK